MYGTWRAGRTREEGRESDMSLGREVLEAFFLLCWVLGSNGFPVRGCLGCPWCPLVLLALLGGRRLERTGSIAAPRLRPSGPPSSSCTSLSLSLPLPFPFSLSPTRLPLDPLSLWSTSSHFISVPTTSIRTAQVRVSSSLLLSAGRRGRRVSGKAREAASGAGASGRDA